MQSGKVHTAGSPLIPWVAAFGLASMWLIYPLVSGPLALLRDFWSWAVFCGVALLSLRQSETENRLLPALAWGLVMAALANAGQGFTQAYRLWNHAATTDVYGFMHQRNQLATLCLLGLAALAWLHAGSTGASIRPSLAQALVRVTALVLGAVVSLSASRTGLLALGLLWLACETLVLHFRNSPAPTALRQVLRTAILGYGLALLPTLATGTPTLGILARQDTQEGVNVCSSRMSLWANVLELIALRPWSGWGWGELDYAHFVTLFRSERFCALLNNAHNLPLQLAVELGIPVALAVCLGALWGVWRERPWFEQHRDRLLAWGLLLPIAIHSLLEYPWWYGPFQVCAVIALWILWRTPRLHATSARDTPPDRRVRTARWALTAGLALVVFAAADYGRASQIYLLPSERLGGFRHDTQQQIRHSLFFQAQIDFADLGLTQVSADNAAYVHELALRMLHFSPEAMVVQKLLASTRLLGLQAETAFYSQRLAAAYPDAFMQWKASQPPE